MSSARGSTRCSPGCAQQSPEPFDARAYVDTGPVQERVYAQHAGIGWIGEEHVRDQPVSSGRGCSSREIICSLPLDVDPPALDQCGTCTLCIEACPTQAIVAPGVLDATRCISYLTIELNGDIPEAQSAGDRVARLRLRRLSGGVSVERAGAALDRAGLAAAAGVGRGGSRGAARPRGR